MISLVVYSLTSFGFAWVIGFSKISYPIRLHLGEHKVFLNGWLLALMECVGCVGFHLGWISYFFGLAPKGISEWWVAGFFTAGSNLILAKFAGLLDSE